MESGGDLLFRAVSSQVPSALKVLTSVFGMGTGGTPSPLPPETVTNSSHSLRFRLPMLASPALLAGSASQTFRFAPLGPRSVIIHSSYLPKVSFCPLEVFLFPGAFAPAFRAAHPFGWFLSEPSGLMRAALSHFATRVRCHTLRTAQ